MASVNLTSEKNSLLITTAKKGKDLFFLKFKFVSFASTIVMVVPLLISGNIFHLTFILFLNVLPFSFVLTVQVGHVQYLHLSQEYLQATTLCAAHIWVNYNVIAKVLSSVFSWLNISSCLCIGFWSVSWNVLPHCREIMQKGHEWWLGDCCHRYHLPIPSSFSYVLIHARHHHK